MTASRDDQIILVLVVLVSVVAVVSAAPIPPTNDTPRHVDRDLTELRSDGPAVWPYTSRSASFTGRTISVNVIVNGSADAVVRHMTEQTAAEWDDSEDDTAPEPVEEFALNGTAVEWSDAHGATRYVYAEPQNGNGRWLDETAQLHDGTYFGTRFHIRLYELPGDGDWTVMQAHHEHWDWFRLRHTVGSVSNGRQYVEADFMETPFVADVWRMHLDNGDTSDADGWATVIELTGIGTTPAIAGAVLATVFSTRSIRQTFSAHLATLNPWRPALLVTPIAVYLGVRATGVLLETQLTGVSPYAITALLYPVIAVGVPTSTFFAARNVEGAAAFALASLGLATAFTLDYAALHVSTLPLEVVVHRAGLIIAIGLLAASARSDVDRTRLAAGVTLWLALLVVALLR